MRVLIFTDYYLPGYKSGGPVRTIENIVSNLGDQIEFYIVTRNHDLGDNSSYPNILENEWNDVGKAQVRYLDTSYLSILSILRVLSKTPHDVIYLNSFFSPKFSLIPLILRFLRFYRSKPIIIAPRGEFSPGALKIKLIKKFSYITLIRYIKFYKNLTWQASSILEASEISRALGGLAAKILVAPDLLPLPGSFKKTSLGHKRSSGALRLIFLSRITEKKNLDYLLKILSKTDKKISLSIYGPKEDYKYWLLCATLIGALPENITVKYRGELSPSRVSEAFSCHDLFAFPTRGENFGHVIYESLASGTPVILSNETPWKSSGTLALTNLALEDEVGWVRAIDSWACFNEERLNASRLEALNYASQYVEKSTAIEQNKKLFSLASNN